MRPSRNRTARHTSDKPTVSSAFTVRHSPRATSSSIDRRRASCRARAGFSRTRCDDLEEPIPIRLRRHGTKRVIKVLDAAKDRVRRASRFELSDGISTRSRVTRAAGPRFGSHGLFRQARTANSGTRGRSRSANSSDQFARAATAEQARRLEASLPSGAIARWPITDGWAANHCASRRCGGDGGCGRPGGGARRPARGRDRP